MDEGPYPFFIDLEATGFGPDSYLIEVAWSDAAGEITRYLINPTSVPAWTDWDVEAERVHGLERGRLIRNGWPVDFVADRVAEALGGQRVYSDAPDYDQRWLGRLFSAVGQATPVRLEHVDELLLATMRRPSEFIWQVVARIDTLKRQAKAFSAGKHSAGYDVGYLVQLWRLANGHQQKMNHGIGPLPDTSQTGTFERIKVREQAARRNVKLDPRC
jgi:hypothetical protein